MHQSDVDSSRGASIVRNYLGSYSEPGMGRIGFMRCRRSFRAHPMRRERAKRSPHRRTCQFIHGLETRLVELVVKRGKRSADKTPLSQ